MSVRKLRYRLGPKFPDFPGSRKTYPKFLRIDDAPPSELQELRTLLKQTAEELKLLSRLTNVMGDSQFSRRMQIRQFSSVLDSFFATLNYYSLNAESRGQIEITGKDHERIRGEHGIKESYTASIKLFSRAMEAPNPNGDKLQLRRPANYWPELRGRITHPRSLRMYQITACDLRVLRSMGKWFQDVQDWSLGLELKSIDDTQARINKNLDDLRVWIKRDIEK